MTKRIELGVVTRRMQLRQPAHQESRESQLPQPTWDEATIVNPGDLPGSSYSRGHMFKLSLDYSILIIFVSDSLATCAIGLCAALCKLLDRHTKRHRRHLLGRAKVTCLGPWGPRGERGPLRPASPSRSVALVVAEMFAPQTAPGIRRPSDPDAPWVTYAPAGWHPSRRHDLRSCCFRSDMPYPTRRDSAFQTLLTGPRTPRDLRSRVGSPADGTHRLKGRVGTAQTAPATKSATRHRRDQDGRVSCLSTNGLLCAACGSIAAAYKRPRLRADLGPTCRYRN